jgi:simple sugar transport system ATP-binding protein
VKVLSYGERRQLEIAMALISSPRVLLLDEPCAGLSPSERQKLSRLVAELPREITVVMIEHDIDIALALADRVTVLRRGRVVASDAISRTTLDALVRAMVGREVSPLSASLPPPQPVSPAVEPALSVEGLRYEDDSGVERLSLSLDVRPGEIVGIAGVEGNGQSELCAALSGMLRPSGGKVWLSGQDVTHESPQRLRELGAGCIAEDRHAVGCHVELSVAENLFLSELRRFTRFGLLSRERLQQEAEPRLRAFDVRGAPGMRLSQLSGGNQQKLVLARELSLQPLRFLLAAQPTRGLDVGAVESVYRALRGACSAGVAVLLVSSELSELLAVADRVLVMYRGKIVGELPGGVEHQAAVGQLMSGQPWDALPAGAAA